MLRALLLILCLTTSSYLPAADIESRSTRMIIPFAAGGAFDILGRQFGDFLERETGKNIIVENIPGNNSIVGSRRHLKSGPNNLMLTSYGFYTAVTAGELRFQDFTPVAVMGHAPLFLVTNKSKKFTCEALRAPGVSYLLAHSGLEQTTGIPVRLIKERYPNVIDVPYKGTPQISIALLSNEVDATFVSGFSMVRPEYDMLANTSRTRVNGVITLRECLGVAKTVENQWLLFASPGSTPEFVQQMNVLATKFATAPDLKEYFDSKGIIPLSADLDRTVKKMLSELKNND